MKMPVLPLLVMALGCGGEGRGGPGRLEVEWTGADTGNVEMPARALWCGPDSVLQITGALGDTGVAVVFLPEDTMRPGVYSVHLPLRARTRPGARLALRWPGRSAIEGFYGISGSVTVDSGETIGGTLEGTLRSADDGREITVIGVFRELTVQPGSAESCGSPPDSSVAGDQ